MSSTADLVWQTQLPIRSTMVINNSGVKFFNKNDQLLTVNNYAITNDISALFLSILSADMVKIEEQFHQQLNCEDNKWQLQLNPKNKNLAAIINSISISGSSYLETIAFQEKRGDETKIKLVADRKSVV